MLFSDVVKLSQLPLLRCRSLVLSVTTPELGRGVAPHGHNSTWSVAETKPCCVGPSKMVRSWWRVLTECGPLEKEMANHFSILALKTP